MRISASFKAAFQTASDKVCADLAAALKAIPQVSKVRVENLTQGTGTLKAKVNFIYAEAKISAWLDREYLRPDSTSTYGAYEAADICFTGCHETVDAMITAVQAKYVGFLRQLADRIVTAPLGEANLNRTQILLMRQTALIDAGFDAEAKLMPNGDFRLIITHPRVKEPLKEIKVV
jgi:hypothetical protein